MINLHLTEITKFIDLENLELYGIIIQGSASPEGVSMIIIKLYIQKILHPLEVVLHEGEAVVWFPGWEHETRILEGLSVSLSLHFDTLMDSLYVQTFRRSLIERVSQQFQI